MMRRARWLRCAAAAALAVAALAASGQQTELAAARGAWRAAALGDYEYGYRKYCECHPDTPPETIVTVRAGAVVGVRHRLVGAANEVPAPRNLDSYWTVDGLFELIDSALRRGATVRASYDPERGYPTQIYVDYDANFIGDELDLRLTTVTALAR